MKKWKCKKSELVYDSKYLKVRKDLVELPNGELKEWTYWDCKDSAMVLGKTTDNKLVMIKQYRYMTDCEVIEFPSGYLNPKESIKKAAKREFEEETSYRVASPLIKLGAFYETYGQLNKRMHIFFASKVVRVSKNIKSDDDVSEDIKVKLVDFKKAVNLALENKILAMGSSLAILLLKEKMKKGYIKI
jgi:ADP-ribose pyrophosphatase